MARYIDADKLIAKYGKKLMCNDITSEEYYAIKVPLDYIPTADVVEVVHGKWKGKPIAGHCTVRCSVCGSAFLDNDGRWKYCPNCGAKMDLR